MKKTAMQLKTIADRLYGIRLPAAEVAAINTILVCAGELNALADQAEKTEETKEAEQTEEK